HKSEQSFECRICKKTFTQRKSFKRHWRLHSRDGFLLCNTCGREISQSQGEGQGQANEILSCGTFYQCDVCKELEAREATGIGYICCVCDAEFDIATELEDHMSMHDNMLPQAR
ncbi:zinc finger 2 homolog, partial [Paramuricea clavata]